MNRAPARLHQLGRTRRDQHHAERGGQDRHPGVERVVTQHVLKELLPHEHRRHQRAEHDDAGARRDPEDPPTRHVEVVQGVAGPTLANDERDARRDRDRDEPEDETPLVRYRREVDREHHRRDQQDRKDAAQVVDRVRRLVHVSRDQPHRQDQGHDGQGQRQEEDRPPPEVLEQQTGEQRTESGDRASQRRPERDRLGTCRPRPERRDQREGGRVRHAGREPAEESGNEQDPIGRRVRGEQARGDRKRRADDQHEFPPVPVPQRPEVQDRRREPERVADGDQVQGRLGRVERSADGGQRDVRHRQVQVGDGRDEDERDQDQTGALGRGRHGAGRPVAPRRPLAHGRTGSALNSRVSS